MQLRCYRCGWSFAIKRDEIEFALEALKESEGGHHDVRCPRCRHTNRVSSEQLRKASPRREPQENGSEETVAESSADDDPQGAGQDRKEEG